MLNKTSKRLPLKNEIVSDGITYIPLTRYAKLHDVEEYVLRSMKHQDKKYGRTHRFKNFDGRAYVMVDLLDENIELRNNIAAMYYELLEKYGTQNALASKLSEIMGIPRMTIYMYFQEFAFKRLPLALKYEKAMKRLLETNDDSKANR